MTESGRPTPKPAKLSARAGVGLKSDHYLQILQTLPEIGWFEVHPENYMGSGGPPHHFLTEIRQNYPLSLHGVGLSIGGDGPLDRDHLARFKALVDRYQPALVSEHLAWSTHDTAFFNDLLPLPYTPDTLRRIVEHVDQMQTHLKRQVLIENPATYLLFSDSTIDEVDFLDELAQKSGCGLLLDVNNVFVSASNHGGDANDYLARFPMHRVGEIHLAGHDQQPDDDGGTVLIDTHDRRVADPVWDLFAQAISSAGPRPTLVEWDGNIPEWPVLHGQARRAQSVLDAHSLKPAEAQHV